MSDKFVICELHSALSSAYLAMWKALESYDPRLDKWSEPSDFGGQENKFKAALELIEKATTLLSKQDARELADKFHAETARFWDLLEAAKTLYRPEIDQFSKSLRNEGLRQGELSITLARSGGSSDI